MRRLAGFSGRSLPAGGVRACGARPPAARRHRGYTIVELLMATTLTLILMGVVVTIFGAVSRSVHQSRAVLEMTDRMRAARSRLQLDLEGLTVTVDPPRQPEAGEGYLEIVEGPYGVEPTHPSFMLPVNEVPTAIDTTPTDNDDVLMFTTRAQRGTFVGRYRDKRTWQDTTIQSDEAEVIWFVRGRTLYRRMLLVAPQVMRPANGDWTSFGYLDNNYDNYASGGMAANPNNDPTDNNDVVDRADLTDFDGVEHAFHELYDLSARPELDQTATAPPWNALRWGWRLNSLGDLTQRENRYAHRVTAVDMFPFGINRRDPATGRPAELPWGQLRLPTLRECSHPWWMTWANLPPDPTNRADPTRLPSVTPPVDATLGLSIVDLWRDPHPWPEVDPDTGTLEYPDPPSPPELPRFMGPRVAEDVILTNVIGFDVKVWDPTAPLFWAVNDQGTPADLTDDTSISSVIVQPGDPGYHLALAHWAIWRQTGSPASGSMGPTYPAPRATGAYVDLDYSAYPIATYLATTYPLAVPWARAASTFSGPGNTRSQLARVYDTWSSHYESDGLDQDGDGLVDEGTDGFDNDGDGVVDDGPDVDFNGDGMIDPNDPSEVGEWETMPPYLAPLRGIQVRIRTFEPDSRQVRTVTLVMDFATK